MTLNETNNMKDYLGKFLFIASLILLGLMIFLIIQKPFLHIDEWFTKGLLTLSLRDMVHITAADVHPPLFYLTVWAPVKILNLLHIPFDKIFVMKIVSVIQYIILYIISFKKIRKDYGWLAGGLFAFMLIALCDFFTVFSIARMYPLGTLLLVCGYISAGEVLKESNLKNWVLLTVFAVLGAYTHYFVAVNFIVLYLILFLNYFLNNKSELKNWFKSAVFGILLFIPWVFVLYNQMAEVGGGYWIKGITLNNIIEFFSSVFTSSSDLMTQIVFAIIFLALFVYVLLQYKKSPKENEFILLGFLIFVGTILVGVVVSAIFKPILVVRYLLPAAAVVLLSISILITKFDFKKVIIPAVILLLLFGAFNVYSQIDEISHNHEKLVDSQAFLDSINNDHSVVVITSKVKLVHFYNELDKAIVYEDYTIDEREGARDWARIFDNKDYKYYVPVDTDYFNNKGKDVYIAYRDDGTKLDLPSGYSLKPVGRVENCQFSKLIHSK